MVPEIRVTVGRVVTPNYVLCARLLMYVLRFSQSPKSRFTISIVPIRKPRPAEVKQCYPSHS